MTALVIALTSLGLAILANVPDRYRARLLQRVSPRLHRAVFGEVTVRLMGCDAFSRETIVKLIEDINDAVGREEGLDDG